MSLKLVVYTGDAGYIFGRNCTNKSMDKSQNLGLWTKEKPFILDFDKL